MLLSALLHAQCCLQSSPIQHQFVWHSFSRTLVCNCGSFHVQLSTRVVSPSLCYVTVSKQLEKPLLDDNIINCLCHHCKILIHGHSS